MAQSVVGFGLVPQIKGLSGGVDRRWVAARGAYTNNDAGQIKRYKPIHVLHGGRGPPPLKCANQNQQEARRLVLPHDGYPPDVEEQGDAERRRYKAPLVDPPQVQPGGYPPQHPYSAYPQVQPIGYPPQQPGGYPLQYPQQYPPQQPGGYPPEYLQQYPLQQPGGYPPQYPQQYPPQQQPPPRKSKWAIIRQPRNGRSGYVQLLNGRVE